MKSIIWGYARVSAEDQNETRQLEALRAAGVNESHIIIDKQSGATFERAGYQYLMSRLDANDALIILSLDRLGRNYDEMREQWRIITQEKKAAIKVLDMPLLDTTNAPDDLDRRFIADLTLQILSYVAAKERSSIKYRQREGIDVMPRNKDGKRFSSKTGRVMGRPEAKKPNNWDLVYSLWQNGKITAVEAIKRTGLSKSTFYKFAKQPDNGKNP